MACCRRLSLTRSLDAILFAVFIIAVESVTLRPEPFVLTSSAPFGADNRTRIALIGMNLDLLSGEGANALNADAEDATHKHYSLKVEYVGQVPPAVDLQGNITTDFRGLYMIVVRLNDAMGDCAEEPLRDCAIALWIPTTSVGAICGDACFVVRSGVFRPGHGISV